MRPATDRMREALFSSLAGRVDGAQVLDLFAGSGAYGLEAWSRGALSVDLYEKHAATVRSLERNVENVARSLGQSKDSATVRRSDLYKASIKGSFDLIIADPPYPDLPHAVPRIRALAMECLAPDGVLCIETPGGRVPELSGFELVKSIGKGRDQPCVSLYERCS